MICQKSFGGPTVTRDGVTVAKEVELEDPFENMGAKLVTEAASKTNDVAGDGTTSATVLTEAILREGLKAVAAGAQPIALKRGMDKAVAAVTDKIAVDLEEGHHARAAGRRGDDLGQPRRGHR